MGGVRFMPIFCLIQFGIFGYVSTEIHLSESQPTKSSPYSLELDNQRSPRQIQPSEGIYPSKKFIKSKLPQNNETPQLFNLGYSVRFENQQNQNIQKSVNKIQRPSIQHGDIITGTRKQNVEIDLPGGSQDESPNNLQQDVHKRKIFGSKLPQNFANLYLESTGQTYVSPTTQKNLEALNNIKDIDYQENLSDLYQQKYTWKNLSPNVKIIRSTEIPSERIENRALSFDHQKALSKSEGFGFSDAIRDENFEKQAFVSQEKVVHKHVDKIPVTTEDFRVIHVQEQINEPSIKPPIITALDVFSPNTNVEREKIFQLVNQAQKLKNQKQILPQVKNPNQILHLPSNALLKTAPLIAQVKPEVVKSFIPKQGYVQQIVLPQVQYESTPKYRGKHKYVKHIPGSRGNIVYTRKVAGTDYSRKTQLKPELRREFKSPLPRS